MAPGSSNSQPIDKKKYHAASTFYLFCKQYIEEIAANGRHFKTEQHGFESAAFKWNAMSPCDQSELHAWFKVQRKAADETEKRKYKIRNGSRRDADYDPVNLGLLKNLQMMEAKTVANLEQRWNWSCFGTNRGLETERFIIVNVDTPLNSSNPGAFIALAMVEFTLSGGIMEEYSVNVERVVGNVGNARRLAINRVLAQPSKHGQSLGDATPAFYAPPGKLEIVFNALIYADDKLAVDGCSDLEKQFSMVRDLSSADVLIRALEKWIGRSSAARIIVPTEPGNDDTLSVARNVAKNIWINFGS